MQSPADNVVQVSGDIAIAVERLRQGNLVAIPTDTVYGLAADADQADAVARVFAAKGRPNNRPLIVLIAGLHVIDGWVSEVPDEAIRLAETFWPGPLTMVLPRGDRVGDHVNGGRATIGIRVPDHPVTLDLLTKFGGGLAAPSANRFGEESPTRPSDVLAGLGAHLDPDRDLILDGGPCRIGTESTIVDLTVSPFRVLRNGTIGPDALERALATDHEGQPNRAD